MQHFTILRKCNYKLSSFLQVRTIFTLTRAYHSCTLYSMRNRHLEWFERTTRNDSNRTVAAKAGISDATLGRQLRDGALKADAIISIAEAYDESPVFALVDLGFISARWTQDIGVMSALGKVTDEELTDELLRRLRLLDTTPVDDLAERRKEKSNSNPEAVDESGYDASRHVAYNGPDEDALRGWEDDDDHIP